MTIVKDTKPPVIGSIGFEIGGVYGTELENNTFVSRAFGIKDNEGTVASVQFEIWKADGSKQWIYQATREGETTWAQSCAVDAPGVYNVYVNAYDNSGNMARAVEQMTVIRVGGHSIMGTSDAVRGQMINFFKANTSLTTTEFATRYGMTIEAFVDLYLSEAAIEGVKADVAFVQMCLETGYLKYGNDVKWEQFNFAGIGATGNGNPGNSFSTPQIGIRAQIQHLKAYATKEPLKQACVDPRYHLVSKGCAPFVEDLGGKWASNPSYGNDLVVLLQKMLKESIYSQYAVEIISDEEPEVLEEETETPKELTPAQDVQNEEVEDNTPLIMGEEDVTQEQALAYLKRKGIDFSSDYAITNEEFVRIFWEEAQAEGVKPGIAFSYVIATGDVQSLAKHNNPGGLSDNNNVLYFDTLDTGIRGYIQHLKCYASEQELQRKQCDPLWSDLFRGTAKTMYSWNKIHGGAEEKLQRWEDTWNEMKSMAETENENIETGDEAESQSVVENNEQEEPPMDQEMQSDSLVPSAPLE